MIVSLKTLKIAVITVACSVALSSSTYGKKIKSFDFLGGGGSSHGVSWAFGSNNFGSNNFGSNNFGGPRFGIGGPFSLFDKFEEFKPQHNYIRSDYKLEGFCRTVPDGGSTLALLGTAILGIIAVGRRFRLVG